MYTKRNPAVVFVPSIHVSWQQKGVVQAILGLKLLQQLIFTMASTA
jgi:hypothetical protein